MSCDPPTHSRHLFKIDNPPGSEPPCYRLKVPDSDWVKNDRTIAQSLLTDCALANPFSLFWRFLHRLMDALPTTFIQWLVATKSVTGKLVTTKSISNYRFKFIWKGPKWRRLCDHWVELNSVSTQLSWIEFPLNSWDCKMQITCHWLWEE